MGRKKGDPPKLKLQPGKFYKARNGDVWCCYRINSHPVHNGAVANCVCVETSIVEYFFGDGRYDISGKREQTLIEEVDAP